MAAFSTFEDVSEIIREKMQNLIDTHIKNFELIYSPFFFEDITHVMQEIINRTDTFCMEKEVELKELLKFRLTRMYDLQDKAVIDFDYMENYFDAVKTKNTKDLVIDNFLNQQRILNILGKEELPALQQEERSESITIEDRVNTHEDVYSVFLIKENTHLDVLYGFSDNKIFVYDSEVNLKTELDNSFGDIREVDFLEDKAAVGSFGGNIYLTKGEELEVYFKYNISL